MHLSFTCAEKYWLTHWRRRSGGEGGQGFLTGQAQRGWVLKEWALKGWSVIVAQRNQSYLPLCWYPLFLFLFFGRASYANLPQPTHSLTWERHVEIIYTSLVFHYEGMRTDVVWATVTGEPALHRTYSAALNSHSFRFLQNNKKSFRVSHLTNGENADWLKAWQTYGLHSVTIDGIRMQTGCCGIGRELYVLLEFSWLGRGGSGFSWRGRGRRVRMEWLRKLLQFCCVY